MTRDTETPLRVLDHSGEDLYVLPYAWDPAPLAKLRPYYLGRPEFEWEFTEASDFLLELSPCRGRLRMLRRWWSRRVTANLVQLWRWWTHAIRWGPSELSLALHNLHCFRPDVLWCSECFHLPGHRPDESYISIQGQLSVEVAEGVRWEDYTVTGYLEPSDNYLHRRLLELAEELDNPEVDRLMAEIPDQALCFMPKRWLEIYLAWRERQLALGQEVSFAHSLDT